MKYNYEVYPANPTPLPEFPLNRGNSEIATYLSYINLGLIAIGGIIALINLFSGGYTWLIFLCIIVINTIFMNVIQGDANKEAEKMEKKNQAKDYLNQAQNCSDKLNDILRKSEEIVDSILPYLEFSANESLKVAKFDFSENAISPFWDRIEEAVEFLALYKQAISQLQQNAEVYSTVLNGKSHNFPNSFPIGISISVPLNPIDELNNLIRNSQKSFEFTNIWEHRKTNRILIEGFQNLGYAINTMKSEIVSSIQNLDYSIQSGFSDLRNIQLEQSKNFQASQELLNNTLQSMDKKLYYLQYNKKPRLPFHRPLSDF